MELWAVARYDLGLSWDEFSDLTPSMFVALCKRRNVRLKHEKFANAQTAAAVYNVATRSAEPLTAYDFVRDPKEAEAHEQRQTLKRQIKDAVIRMPQDTDRAKFMRLRGNIIKQLEAIGRTDAAELWAECWPSLVPEGDICQ